VFQPAKNANLWIRTTFLTQYNTFNSTGYHFRNLQAAVCAYYDLDQPSVKQPELAFVNDVTIGEGEAVPPNTTFIKTWRLGNPGNVLNNFASSLINSAMK